MGRTAEERGRFPFLALRDSRYSSSPAVCRLLHILTTVPSNSSTGRTTMKEVELFCWPEDRDAMTNHANNEDGYRRNLQYVGSHFSRIEQGPHARKNPFLSAQVDIGWMRRRGVELCCKVCTVLGKDRVKSKLPHNTCKGMCTVDREKW
jgi:hypothetical protein